VTENSEKTQWNKEDELKKLLLGKNQAKLSASPTSKQNQK